MPGSFFILLGSYGLLIFTEILPDVFVGYLILYIVFVYDIIPHTKQSESHLALDASQRFHGYLIQTGFWSGG